jgi:CheY-like chemotaxis protein
MPADERPRILCVDDDPAILESLGRTLRRHFSVETSTDPMAAVQRLGGRQPFAVVLSDMRMPGMNGAEFLALVREIAPDTVRVLLTGYADWASAMAAVNRGNVFRFLTKPCDSEVLISSLKQAAEQYRLITLERVMLEQTLRASVEALTNILALVHPLAFGRALRADKSIRELLDCFTVPERWPVEVSAMLSQIGCVVLPPHTVEALYRGDELSVAEQQMVERMPQTIEDLLAPIPRLEPVRAILRLRWRNYDDLSPSADISPSICWGSSALKIVLDYDELECRNTSSSDIVNTMRGRKGWYDPTILEVFARLRGSDERGEIQEIAVSEVQVGTVLADDVTTLKGVLLIARGQSVTPSLIERIKNFSVTVGVREPIRVAPAAHEPISAAAPPATRALPHSTGA